MTTYTVTFDLAEAQTGVSGHYPLLVKNSTYNPDNTLYAKTGDTVKFVVSEPSPDGASVSYNNTNVADTDPDPDEFTAGTTNQNSPSSWEYTITSAAEDSEFYWYWFGTTVHSSGSGKKYSQKVRVNRVSGTLGVSSSTVKQGGTLTFSVSSLSGLLANSDNNGNFLRISIFNSSNQWVTTTGDSGLTWDSSTNQLGRIKTTDTSTNLTIGSSMATGTYTAYLTHYNAADTPGGNDFMGSEHRIGSSVTFTVNTGTVSNVGLGTDIVNATPQQVYVRNTATANNAALSMDGTAYKPTVSISGTGTGNDAKYKRLNADDIYQDSSWRTDSSTVEHGWTVDVSLKASASFDSTTTATLTIGNASDQLAITTGAADVTPDAFNSSLTNVTNNTYTGMAKSTVITSNIMTLSGTNQVTSVGLSGDTSPQFRKRANSSSSWGSWTSSQGTLEVGYQWQFKVTTSNLQTTTQTGTITIGGVSGSIIHTTEADQGTGGGGTGGGAGTSAYGVKVVNAGQTLIFGSNMRSNHLIKSGQVSIAAAGSGGSNPQYSTVTGVEGLLADNDDDVAIVLTTGSMSDARYVIGVSISNRGTAQFTLKNVNAIVTVVDYYVIRI